MQLWRWLDALRYKDAEIQRAMEQMRLPNRVLLSDTETNGKKGKIRKSWQQLTKIVKISNENYDSGDDFSERALIRVPFSCACSHPI